MKSRIIALLIAAMLLFASCDTDGQTSGQRAETSERSSLIRETEIVQNVQTVSSSPYAWGIKYIELPEGCWTLSMSSSFTAGMKHNTGENTVEIIFPYEENTEDHYWNKERFVLASYDMTGNLLEHRFFDEPEGYSISSICFSDSGYYYICYKDQKLYLLEYIIGEDKYVTVFEDIKKSGDGLFEQTLVTHDGISFNATIVPEKVIKTEDGIYWFLSDKNVSAISSDGTLMFTDGVKSTFLQDIYTVNGTIYIQNQDNALYTPNLETGQLEYSVFCKHPKYDRDFNENIRYDFINNPPDGLTIIFGGSSCHPTEYNDLYFLENEGIFSLNYIGLDKPEEPEMVVDYASTGLTLSTSMVRKIITPSLIAIEANFVLDTKAKATEAKPAFLYYDTEKAAEEKKSLELLHIGGMGSYINNAVSYFNMTSGEYRIDLVDYARYKTDDNPNGAIDKMELDFANGDYPDLIFISKDMDITNYTSKGMLMNLYDLGFDSSKLLGGVRTVSEFADGLYRLPLTFGYSALLNREGIEKLTPDELYSLYSKHGNGLFPQLSRDMLIDSLTKAGIYNAYIDYENAKCDFDNAEFVKYLEFLRSYNNVPRKGLEPIFGNSVGKEHLQLVKGHESLFYVANTTIVDGLLGIYNFMYEDTGYTFSGFATTEASGIVIKPSNEFAVTAACAYRSGTSVSESALRQCRSRRIPLDDLASHQPRDSDRKA